MKKLISSLVVAAAVVGAGAPGLVAKPVPHGSRTVNVEIQAHMGAFSPAVIKVHRGDTVHVTLRAMDTAHGFRVQGREDIDLTSMPGQPVEATFVVDWDGGREWFCTFMCGSQHGTMSGMIVSTTESDD